MVRTLEVYSKERRVHIACLLAASLQQTYSSDPKYKKYAQQVEKCLSSFDSVHEWADFISFLKQLLKVRVHSATKMRVD